VCLRGASQAFPWQPAAAHRLDQPGSRHRADPFRAILSPRPRRYAPATFHRQERAMVETLESRELFSVALTNDAPAPPTTADPAPAVVVARDRSTGMPTGRRSSQPLVIAKVVDQPTP